MNAPVLVVDDNASKRVALRAVLEPLGCTIVEAGSGLEALRCIMAQDFAVILLDVRMPGMDGFETAALIRLRWQSEMTPIIFVTANADAEVMNSDRYAEGAVDFMTAPLHPEELRAKVSALANLFTRAETLAARARELQTSADQLRLLTDAAPIGIFQTDAANAYSYTNPRWSEITGLSAEDAAGQAWDSILGSTARAELRAEFRDGSIDRAGLCHRFEITPPGVEPRIVLVTSRAVPDADGGMAGWVGTLADVTAEAGAEAAMTGARDEATEASRLKSDFLANMSHEIRTPMNGVIGMTDLLLETDLDARQRDYAQTVRNSGEALLTIINDILDFSKVEAGKLEIEDTSFSVRTILADVVDLLARTAQTKGLELVTMVDKAVPDNVGGDPGRVRQVLTNLIGNAIKFTHTGEIVVRVTATESTGDQSLVLFEVSDTGDGIAPDKVTLIFQPFAQADTSTSRKYGGTGLGLAISSQLVTLMGGDCGVSSTLGTGSRFWFTISVHTNGGDIGRDLRDDDLVGMTALVVDDSASQRAVLSEHLTDMGMTVRSAQSATAALATLRTAAIQGRPFALALIDWGMPEMDGFELCQAISADPALTPRLVLMTGLGGDRDLGEASGSAAYLTISKPVRVDDLHDRLRASLGLHDTTSVRPETAVADPSASNVHGEVRLLLAEDNLINQKVAVAMLVGAGYRVDTVLNGAAAVEAFGANRYDAVLMDCQMPELNGYEATAAIRAHEGADRHTPIIAMTAGARREDRKRCLAEGMDGYLAKPVSKDALLAMVRRFVGKQKLMAPSSGANRPRRAQATAPSSTSSR